MKKTIFSLLAVWMSIIWLSIGSVALADSAGYTIESYDVSMDVKIDGSMDVTEKIGVNFTESRHWIFRKIPITNLNTKRVVTIENLTAIGDPIASNGIIWNYYEIKLWSSSVYLNWPHTYTIKYTVKNAIVPFGTEALTGANYALSTWWSDTISGNQWQELYRNVIWGERETSIKNVSYSVILPKGISFSSGQTFIYYGSYGQKKTAGATLTQVTPTKIAWSVNQTLSPKEGMSIWLQFPSSFFSLPANYEKYFYAPWNETPSQAPASAIANPVSPSPDYSYQTPGHSSGWSFLKNVLTSLFRVFFWLFFAVVFFNSSIKSIIKGSASIWKPAWKSEKTTTIYYTPPKNIEPLKAFYFWYNTTNPRIFTALLYYRATKWRVTIKKTQKKSIRGLIKTITYIVTEKEKAPSNQTPIEAATMQDFFGSYDETLDSITLEQTQSVRTKISHIFEELESSLDKNNELIRSWGRVFKKYTLTEKGEQLFEEMRGWKEYLQKVERPVIEQELKNDPDFINKILPWAVLFGIETKLLAIIGDLVQDAAQWWYSSYDGTLLNPLAFKSMNSAMAASTVIPQSSSSGWFSWGGWWFSWFGWGGGGGFSWWGGWWGGGGSW